MEYIFLQFLDKYQITTDSLYGSFTVYRADPTRSNFFTECSNTNHVYFHQGSFKTVRRTGLVQFLC